MKKFLIMFIVLCIVAAAISLICDEELRRANTSVCDAFPCIIVDAGHGGFDGGAVKGDIIEKNINLDFALDAEIILKAFGYEVIMTRTTDTGTQDAGLSSIHSKKVSDIKNRLSLVENTDTELFLSFHQNMFSQSQYSGTQSFYGTKNPKSVEIAESIQQSVRALLQNDNTRVKKPCGKNIYLMYHITKPSVMVECGFMSNERELKNLLDGEYRKKLTFCIITGLLNSR